MLVGEAKLMKCPHCTTSIHESWTVSTVYINLEKTGMTGTNWRIQYMICPACNKSILRFGKAEVGQNYITGPSVWEQFYPSGSSRPPVPTVVPKDISADYSEAARVLNLSPKASAALSRRCLQSVLRDAGYTQKDLSKQIDAAITETDARKALPSGVHLIVDAIRNFGNFAAHKITDQTTLQLIDVEPAEAEYCLDVLDSVFDHYYVKPAQAKAIKAALDAKLVAAKKPPSK
jgi:Domain of unknown function (DUF4145)